jgi:hypothetical protein
MLNRIKKTRKMTRTVEGLEEDGFLRFFFREGAMAGSSDQMSAVRKQQTGCYLNSEKPVPGLSLAWIRFLRPQTAIVIEFKGYGVFVNQIDLNKLGRIVRQRRKRGGERM